ncbi:MULTISPECIES: hypothetical protein [Burkholderia]|jgi:adenosyl cobinamide kinase/adenosyl cobinamide phosphate guanylyltransferase|uniref:Uncharacterized protein n=3 Tax=root TaxID=1 RepID=A0A1E3FXK5_9BURK|nr:MULTISPECIES: hypothetical protein [Burkholderia]UTP27580.1 hypothetical protein NMB33_36065 [Burkholderia sp. FXe9]MBA9828930.1 hypothetical protein [Burkholderia contaminans]MBA9838171.1 hypothetical protein [Burkholderia contaminans]MBA9862349.1 hypothetical protein [Burkholderia contaminans]MBA9907463.1 hypothetical protein [Burkholderia contaminans]
MTKVTQRPPIWRPIEFLPILFYLVDAQLDEARATFDKLTRHTAEGRMPDPAMRERVRHHYTNQRKLMPIQYEQFMRWQWEATTAEQRDMLTRFGARADHLAALYDSIIVWLDESSRATSGVKQPNVPSQSILVD